MRFTKRLQGRMRFYCQRAQQYRGYILNSAYHNIVVVEGCADHEDGAQKTGNPLREVAVKLLAP